MFFLQNIINESVFYLKDKNEFVVGRKDCDILIQDDNSISRKHAIIKIKNNEIVTIEDCGSKYKTLHGDTNLDPNVEVVLKINDVIHFGLINSKYRLKILNIVTTGTLLSPDEKVMIRKNINILQGRYVDNWSLECTHLTLKEMTTTLKMLLALVDEKPIVIPEYWTVFAKNLAKNIPPPNINEYNQPPIKDDSLTNINFESNHLRKKLFTGKIFVFLKEKEKKQYDELINKTGGSTVSLEKTVLSMDNFNESQNNEYLIIETPLFPLDGSNFQEVLQRYRNLGKRVIPLQEIAMAILKCNCDKDCNSNFRKAEVVFTRGLKDFSLGTVIMQNTENQTETEKSESQGLAEEPVYDRKIIPDTFSQPLEDIVAKERNLLKIEPDKGSVKEVKVENYLKKFKPTNSTGSHQRDETDVSINKPSHSDISQLQKRKANCESLEVNLQEKTQKENPFKTLQNQKKKIKLDPDEATGKVNPFRAILIKEENTIEKQTSLLQNPFFASKKRKEKEGYDEVLTKNKRLRLEQSVKNNVSSDPVNFCSLSYRSKDDLNSTWLSKKDTTVKVKDEPFDEEMQQFIGLFKNTVVVEFVSNLVMRPDISAKDEGLDEVDSRQHLGKKNFKKFVKVKPLRPQTVVIGRDYFKPLGMGDTSSLTQPSHTRKKMDVIDDVEFGIKKSVETAKKYCI